MSTVVSGRISSSRLGTPMSPAPRLGVSARSVQSSSLVVRDASARESMPKTPVAVAPKASSITTASGPPKVPMLRLGNTSTAVASVLSVPERKGSASVSVGTRQRVPSGKSVSKQPSSRIFEPASRPATPKVSAFHAKHTHSDPFSGTRQQPLPATSKRTSIAPGAAPVSHSPCKIRTLSQARTDPINQREATPSVTGRDLSQARMGRRCQSAPASRGMSEPALVKSTIRCVAPPPPSEEKPIRPGTRCAARGPSLTGVWTPVEKPVKPVVTRAPFAQNTPRAATPPATVRRASTPYATNTPRVAAERKPIAEMRKPFHTNTPRAPSPSTSRHVVQAPFHTSTPRVAAAAKVAHSVKPVLH